MSTSIILFDENFTANDVDIKVFGPCFLSEEPGGPSKTRWKVWTTYKWQGHIDSQFSDLLKKIVTALKKMSVSRNETTRLSQVIDWIFLTSHIFFSEWGAWRSG